jgi:uncharacterized protein CbrC (UPF0167 family)
MPTVKLELTDSALTNLRNEIHPMPSSDLAAPLTSGCWFIRTVTYHLVGRIVGRTDGFLLLKNASWVADSGRFMQAIKNGTLNEVEPVGDAVVNISTIVDAFPWSHALPLTQK